MTRYISTQHAIPCSEQRQLQKRVRSSRKRLARLQLTTLRLTLTAYPD